MVRLLTLVLVALLTTAPAWAQRPSGQVLERVAAVVNDEPISLSDLQAREKLILLSSGLTDSPETRDRIRQQVLRSLVDEALQRQEARRNGVTVTPEEVQRGVATIAGQNRMSAEQMRRMLDQNGIPASTLENQVRAFIAWSRLLQRRYRPGVDVTDEDVDAALRRMEENVGKPEYLAAEIFLSVDRPELEGDVRAVADRLSDQIRGGAPFAQVARQFSQSAGASSGGDLGWIQQGQLAPELDEALVATQPGQITRPIRSASGWHILALRDRRTAGFGEPAGVEIEIRQVVLPIPQQLDAFGVLDFAQKSDALRSRINGCDTVDAAARSAGATAQPPRRAREGELPAELLRVVRGLQPGQASPAVRTPEGSVIFVLCSRREIAASRPSREQIESNLAADRLDLVARRLLRDLRRSAFVDIRV